MTFLWWFDDNAKRTPAQKIEAGAAAYQTRYGAPCTLVLVNEADTPDAPIDGLTVRPAANVRRHNYWFGQEAAA